MALSRKTNYHSLVQMLPTVAALILAAIVAGSVRCVSASLDVLSSSRTGADPRRWAAPARHDGDGRLAFTLTMMGSRRGKGGNLKRSLDGTTGRGGATSAKNINRGRGQEITGVTLPEKGKIRGWAFGEDRTICAANVDGDYFGIDGTCPRCAFDLYKGKLLTDKDVWGSDPRVACPTCSTTYSLKTGKFGPEYKSKGLTGWVNTWAQTATVNNAMKDVLAYVITRDEETGKVFCRER